MKQFLITTLLGLLLVGCATTPGEPVTPEQALYQTKQVYSVAQGIAVMYASQPLCNSPKAPQVCSDPKTVVDLDTADSAAVKAIKAAEDAIRTGAPNVMILLNAASAAAASLDSKAKKVKP